MGDLRRQHAARHSGARRGQTGGQAEQLAVLAIELGQEAPWSAWRWGTFTPWFYEKVNDYALDKIKGNVGALQPALDRVPDDNIAPHGQPPFNPRQFLEGQLSKFTTDPVGRSVR